MIASQSFLIEGDYKKMKLYSDDKNYKLYHGNMLDMEEVIEPNSIDSIVTDPPYELGFMNCKWDNSGIAFQKETWRKCYDALKSGGHMLVFGGSRTFHRIACAIEDAGFEIRDTIMWIYGCLSEDTEILTSNEFKNFHKITKDDVIKVYDIENGIYKWEKPERWNVYSVDSEVCYRIKSNDTDQLVSKNHRCLIERNGKLVFEYAENLNENESVPIVLYDGDDCSVYQTTMATVTKEEYSGIIYCPTVSTGCFVARRNGKVFITGNSGFPKSMNIGLAIDKRNGIESPIVGQNEQILKKQAKDLREGKRKIVDSFNSGASERNNGFKTVSADIKLAQNEWAGWGTQLKPSYEPIIVCRKPCEGSIVDNVMKYGVGGINIDECRVPISKDDIDMINAKSSKNPTDNYNRNESKKYGDYVLNIATTANEQGRFPANTILTYDDSDYDEVCGGFPNSGSGNGGNPYNYAGKEYNNKDTSMFNGDKPQSPSNYNDSGSASRYFYCAKASKRDRNDGVDGYNIHCTVKPTSLMQYFVRLVTPKGGTVLDPFNGSGSTGKACMYENADRNANYKYIGIELTEEYLPISKARIEFAEKNPIMDYEIKKTKIENKTSRNKINDNELESIFDL